MSSLSPAQGSRLPRAVTLFLAILAVVAYLALAPNAQATTEVLKPAISVGDPSPACITAIGETAIVAVTLTNPNAEGRTYIINPASIEHGAQVTVAANSSVTYQVTVGFGDTPVSATDQADQSLTGNGQAVLGGCSDPTPDPTGTTDPDPEPTNTGTPTPDPTGTTDPDPEPTSTGNPDPETVPVCVIEGDAYVLTEVPTDELSAFLDKNNGSYELGDADSCKATIDDGASGPDDDGESPTEGDDDDGGTTPPPTKPTPTTHSSLAGATFTGGTD